MGKTKGFIKPLALGGSKGFEFARVGGWVRAGMKEKVEGERVRAGKKIKICFVIYFSGGKKFPFLF
jgi:hypothetical protein